MACINAALGTCLSSYEFMCVSAMGLVRVRKCDLLCAPLAAAEDKKMSQELLCHLQHLLSPGNHKWHATASKGPAAFYHALSVTLLPSICCRVKGSFFCEET